MLIVFFSRRFYPEIGGVEKHVLEIAKRLVKKGYKVYVVTEISPKNQHIIFKNYQSIGQSDTYSINLKEPVNKPQIDHQLPKGINIIRFNFGNDDWFKKFRVWLKILKIKKLIAEADVVHCHDVFFWYMPFRFLFPKKAVYTTFHGYESYPIKRSAIIMRKISEMLSSGTICVGEFMKKWYGAKPDFVIYGGVNLPKPKIVKEPSAFFWGRLDEQTNILEYSRAVLKLKKRISGFEFVMAGDGKYKRYAQRSGRVLGFIKGPEKLLTDYRFAFVSRYLSILEAMAAKKMVFAYYDNPLKRDYLEMTPFKNLIKIFSDENELIKAVQFYCSNNKLEQKDVNKAYSWVKKQSWEKVTRVYERLWKI